MNKKQKIQLLLKQIEEKVSELLEYDDPEVEVMSAEETILLASSMVTQGQGPSIKYSQPIGIVDTSRASFVLDENFEVNLEDQDEN